MEYANRRYQSARVHLKPDCNCSLWFATHKSCELAHIRRWILAGEREYNIHQTPDVLQHTRDQ